MTFHGDSSPVRVGSLLPSLCKWENGAVKVGQLSSITSEAVAKAVLEARLGEGPHSALC